MVREHLLGPRYRPPPAPIPSGCPSPLSLSPCGLGTRTCVPACVPEVLSSPSTELRRPELVGMCVLKLMGTIKLAKREKGWIGSPWLVLRNDPPALGKGLPSRLQASPALLPI